mmetsp:Transcript_17052/g.34110  ORF Transcript_17052/g.34110 Transcript_17052/m.34110 type:complete len:535 (+) Transcript_17052:38-1642(+)
MMTLAAAITPRLQRPAAATASLLFSRLRRRAITARHLSAGSAAAADRHHHQHQHQHQQQLSHDPAARLPLPPQYLRDADFTNYDASTHQRTDASYDGHSGRPIVSSSDASAANNPYYKVKSWRQVNDAKSSDIEVTWADGATTTYPKGWVDQQAKLYADGHGIPSTPDTSCEVSSSVRRVLWSNITEEDVRGLDSGMAITFGDLVGADTASDGSDGEGMSRAIAALYKHGLLLVTGTPLHDGGTGLAALAAAVSGGDVKSSPNASLLARYRQQGGGNAVSGSADPITILPDGTDGPLRTLYGSVWSTHSSAMAEGASVADSAYSNDGLPLHTDMTYMRDPPGLQIFAMAQPAPKGGESIFGDGFAVAERLRSEHPDAFDTLCSTTRRYRSICTETGWHLEGRGPVISAIDRGHGLPPASRWGEVTAIRHNDLDRLPDLPPLAANGSPMDEAESDEFYAKLRYAHQKWDTLLGSDEFRLVLQLKPGDTVVVTNQRCFHGRYGFEASRDKGRIVMGCYVSQDDLDSRFRRAGFALW